MKKLSKSADSFVEMMIVPERLFFDYQHDSRLVEEMMDNAAAYEREQELLKGMQAKALHPQYHQAAAKISGKVIHEVTGDAKYVRTSTQVGNLSDKSTS